MNMVVKTGQWMQDVYNATLTPIIKGENISGRFAERFNFFQWAKSKNLIITYKSSIRPIRQEWQVEKKLADACDLWLANQGYGDMSFVEFATKLGLI